VKFFIRGFEIEVSLKWEVSHF